MANFQYQKLKKMMTESSYTFTDEWLTACITWVKENYSTTPINDEFLKKQIFEQWLETDLEEMESSCLPINLEQKKCIQLTGRFGLQINSLQDIGESSYSQLNRLKKTESENTTVEATDSTAVKAWEPKPRRCLYLTLTDGSQKVFGLEMTSIPSLTLAIKPGAKVIIIGPVECRRGVMQLKSGNVKFLGGEVEQLAIPNSVENILARNLHQPESTSASAVTESQLRGNNYSASDSRSISTVQESNTNNYGEFPDDDDFDEIVSDALSDDIFMDIDESALMASTTNSINSRETQVIPQSALTNPVNSFYHPIRGRNTSIDSDSGFPSIDEINELESRSFTSINEGNLTRGSRDFVTPAPKNTVRSAPGPSAKSQVPPSSKVKANSSSSSKTSGFKNAKTETCRQLKIEKYLKPMPVIIDPPTPEREARKKFKIAKRDDSCVANVSESVVNIPIVAVVDLIPSSIPNDEILMDDDNSGDSLMDMVESSIAAQLKSEESLLDSVTLVPSTTPTTCDKITTSVSVSKHPYVFLKQIHQDWDNHCRTRKVLYVKACIATLLSNIRMDSGQWALDVCVNDGSGFLNCTISPTLLNQVIGFTPVEMKQLKKLPEGKAKISNSMKNLTTTLVHWNGIFGIQVGTNPLVVSYNDVMIHHIAALKERLSHIQ